MAKSIGNSIQQVHLLYEWVNVIIINEVCKLFIKIIPAFFAPILVHGCLSLAPDFSSASLLLFRKKHDN